MYHANEIRITKLFIHETGTYSDQFRRPYTTELSGPALAAVHEKLAGDTKFRPSALAGLVNGFLSPSATPEKEIIIPQGWSERRLRYVMELQVSYRTGGVTIQNVLGYTNYTGATAQGSIDPQMEFFVNSVMQLRSFTERTPVGMVHHNTVAEASHVLVDNNWNGIYASADQRMRPEDVIAAMGRNMWAGETGTVVDMRTTANNVAVKAKRTHEIATNYAHNILENYRNATITEEFGQGQEAIISSARGYAQDAPAATDPFLSAIARIRGMPIGNTFTFGDLVALDPNVAAVTHVVWMNEAERRSVHQAGQTAHWSGSDYETKTATYLSHAVAALMMELSLTGTMFSSSNRNIGGQLITILGPIQTFSNMDQSGMLQVFIARLEREILLDITMGNQIDFALEMRVDLLGETWLSLSVNSGPFIDYAVPSFADALLTPLLTSNMENANRVARDFGSLVETVIESAPSKQPSQDFGLI